MRKLLTKILILLLIGSLSVSAGFAMVSCKENDEESKLNKQERERIVSPLNIGVLADIHVWAESQMETLDNFVYTDYMSVNNVTRDLPLSEAILKTAVDEMIAKKPDVVFAVGDMTENGSLESLNVVKTQLSRLEAAGIPVFVTNGKCDSCSPIAIAFTDSIDGMKRVQSCWNYEFAEEFKDFGYSEAVMKDTDSLSYLADIPGTDYRVLALDNVKDDSVRGINLQSNLIYYSFSDDTLAWIQSALENCERLGKQVLVTTNTPLNKCPSDIFTAFNDGMYRYVLNGDKVEELLTTYNVHYLFQGETHIEAQKEVFTQNGTLTELSTSCLCSYPGYIKTYNINSFYEISECKEPIKSIPEGYVPDIVSSDVKALVTTDYKSYIKERFKELFIQGQQSGIYNKGYESIINTFHVGKTEGEYKRGIPMLLNIFKELELYSSENDEIYDGLKAINDDFVQWMFDVDNLHLYGESSVQSFCTVHGIEMPVYAEYSGMTTNDFFIDLFLKMLDGTFVKDEDGKVAQIFTCVFYAGLDMVVSIDLFNRLHELNDLIEPCDMSIVVNNYLATDTIDIKLDDFLLSVMSLFKVYFANHNVPLTLTDTKTILKVSALVVSILQNTIPEMKLFFPNGQTTTSYCDIENGLIFGKEFVSEIMLQVLSRTAIVI